MVSVELLQGLVEQRVLVLEAVSLVNHEGGPGDGVEDVLVLEQDLVGGDQGVELGPLVAGVDPLLGAEDGPARHVTDVGEHVHVRPPLLELVLPGVEGGEGHDDEEGAVEGVLVEEVVEEGDGLDGLAEPHLVGQDHRVVLGPGVNQPVDTLMYSRGSEHVLESW